MFNQTDIKKKIGKILENKKIILFKKSYIQNFCTF